jgi:hypothetical protein
MRDDDDDAAGSAGGPLAEGLGEVIGSGGPASTGDPLGDGAPSGEGTFGEGEVGAADDAGTIGGGDGILAESSSPLEGIGYILDELHSALFGDDEAAATDEAVNAALSQDPADLETDTDLDLTGDGVVGPDDLDEAASPFDFGVDAHGG